MKASSHMMFVPNQYQYDSSKFMFMNNMDDAVSLLHQE